MARPNSAPRHARRGFDQRLGRPYAVARAVADLRRGDAIVLRDEFEAVLAFAAEAFDEERLAEARSLTGSAPSLVITLRRAVALGFLPHDQSGPAVVRLRVPADVAAASLRAIADPTVIREEIDTAPALDDGPPSRVAVAAIELTKLARVLPAMVMFSVQRADLALLTSFQGAVELGPDQVLEHRTVLAHGLKRVADARVPLADAERARIVAFRPDDGGLDHLAILIGDPAPDEPVLARIHSECFTGDLLGSLRCDCGDQLRGAIRAIAAAGSGVLVYLAQEGRGIGLVNKLRAYRLQDEGFDTVDANLQLGFDADERVYQPAAEILRQLGFERVRLMTNNPEKVAALQHCGIAVVERVPHAFEANDHNRAYLSTKAAKSGHLL